MENCTDRRRQTVNTGGLRRSRSVRASLRKLGDRWKSQPKNHNQKPLLDSSPEVAGKKAKSHHQRLKSPNENLTPNCVQHLNLGFQNESTEDWISALEFTKHLDESSKKRHQHLRQHSLDGSLQRRSDFADPDFDIRKTEYYKMNKEFLDANSTRTLDVKKGDSRRMKKLGYFFGSADLETHQVYFSDRHERSFFGDDQDLANLRIPRAVTLTHGAERYAKRSTATIRTTSMWTSSNYLLV